MINFENKIQHLHIKQVFMGKKNSLNKIQRYFYIVFLTNVSGAHVSIFIINKVIIIAQY